MMTIELKITANQDSTLSVSCVFNGDMTVAQAIGSLECASQSIYSAIGVHCLKRGVNAPEAVANEVKELKIKDLSIGLNSAPLS